MNKTKGKVKDIDKIIGIQLKTRRTELGYSQKYIGKALYVSTEQIRKYEEGINRISASSLYQLAKLLKVSLDYFFAPTHLEFINTSSNYKALQLMQAFNQLRTDKLQTKIIEIINLLNKEE